MKEVEFAGHGVGHVQRRGMQGNLAALHYWEQPTTISELRSFISFCYYFSGDVRMYAELWGPLHKMLQVRVGGLRVEVSGTRRSSAPGGYLVGPGDILPTGT